MKTEVWVQSRQGLRAGQREAYGLYFTNQGLQTSGPQNDSDPQMFCLADFRSRISRQRLKPKEFTSKFSFLACGESGKLAMLSCPPHVVTPPLYVRRGLSSWTRSPPPACLAHLSLH